jgi:hypothetical protein
MIILLVPLVVILHYSLVTDWVLSVLLLIVSIPLVWMMYAHLNKRHQQENRFHELYFFLQQLIMTLSIKSNVYESYQDVLQNMHPSQQKRLLSFQATDVLVSLQSMHMYFKHPLYALSLENFAFYDQHGGDILSLCEPLLDALRLEEIRVTDRRHLMRKNQQQFILIWLLNIAMVFLAKWILADLFTRMQNGWLFQLMLTLFFAFIPLTGLLWVLHDQESYV